MGRLQWPQKFRNRENVQCVACNCGCPWVADHGKTPIAPTSPTHRFRWLWSTPSTSIRELLRTYVSSSINVLLSHLRTTVLVTDEETNVNINYFEEIKVFGTSTMQCTWKERCNMKCGRVEWNIRAIVFHCNSVWKVKIVWIVECVTPSVKQKCRTLIWRTAICVRVLTFWQMWSADRDRKQLKTLIVGRTEEGELENVQTTETYRTTESFIRKISWLRRRMQRRKQRHWLREIARSITT